MNHRAGRDGIESYALFGYYPSSTSQGDSWAFRALSRGVRGPKSAPVDGDFVNWPPISLSSAWLRPRIAPLAIVVAAAALSGRDFRTPGGIIAPARPACWRVVNRRAFEEAGWIVRVRPCGRGEDKSDKPSAR